MNDRVERDRTTISLPADLAEYARAKGDGNTSAYLAALIEKDRRVDTLSAMFIRHGYTGDKAITAEGAARMRQRLAGLRTPAPPPGE